MNWQKVYPILFSFIFLCNSLGFPQERGEYGLPSLIGLDLSSNDRIGFLFSNARVDKDAATAYPLKYFFTTLLVPNDELWVNLSPNLADIEIIGKGINNTDLGRLLLSYDLRLKEDVEELLDVYGDEISDYVVNGGGGGRLRFWIEPGLVKIEVDEGKARIKSAPLEVKVEVKGNKKVEKWIERELIPILEEKVNKGEGYARLRQAYNSMILAQWYKRRKKPGMVFSEYIDTKAKGAGIISDEIWFKASYLEEYVRMYYRGGEDRGIWSSFVVGGIEGEVKQIREMMGNIPEGPDLYVTDRNREIEKEIGKDFKKVQNWYKRRELGIDSGELNRVINKAYKMVNARQIKEIGGEEDVQEIMASHTEINVMHMGYRGKRKGEEVVNRFEVIPWNKDEELIVLRELRDPDLLEKMIDEFKEKLKEGKDVKLVCFLNKDILSNYRQSPELSKSLYILFDLYTQGLDRVILLREGQDWEGKISNKDGVGSILSELPSLALLGQDLILAEGALIRVSERMSVKDLVNGRGKVDRYVSIRGCGLIRFEGERPEIVFYGKKGEGFVSEGGSESEEVVSTERGKVRFREDSLNEIIFALNGEVKEDSYFVIDRDKNGDIVVSPYEEGKSCVLSLDASIVKIDQNGIGPGFIYDEEGVVKDVLLPINDVTWESLPILREILDKEMRSRYYGKKENICKGIKIDGVEEIRLRGVSENEFRDEMEKILSYRGERDLYIWTCPGESGYVLRVQSHRPIVYDKEERGWMLMRVSHISGRIEWIRKKGLGKNRLKKLNIGELIGAIKKAFIPYYPERFSYVRVEHSLPGKGKFSVGTEFLIEKGTGVELWVRSRGVSLTYEGDKLVLKWREGYQIDILRSERVFLGEDLKIVDSIGDAKLMLELGEDGFIRVIRFAALGPMHISQFIQTNSVVVPYGSVKQFKYVKDGKYKLGIVSFVSSSKIVISDVGFYRVTIEKQPRGNKILLDDNFNTTSDLSEAKLEILFRDGRVVLRVCKGCNGSLWTSMSPSMYMRNIVYKESAYASKKQKFPGVSRFYSFAIPDVSPYVVGFGEHVIVDWGYDKALMKLYTDVVKELVNKLREIKGINLSNKESSALVSALIRLDRTEVEMIMAKIDGRVKSYLINYLYDVVTARVKYGDPKVEKYNSMFIGNLIDAKGVCRHTSVLTGAILQRLSEAGFLLGKSYQVYIPSHAFNVYITSMRGLIVFDVAQGKLVPINGFSEELVLGLFRRRCFETIREIYFKFGYKEVLKRAGFKIPNVFEYDVNNNVGTSVGFLRREHIRVKYKDLPQIPMVLRSLLIRDFCSGKWQEGPIPGLLRELYGNKRLVPKENKYTIPEWDNIRDNIARLIRWKSGEIVKEKFITRWGRIKKESGSIDRVFRFLSLLHGYRVYAIAPDLYKWVLGDAAEKFRLLVEKAEKERTEEAIDLLRKAMDDLIWYDRNYMILRFEEDYQEKGGLILSLHSLAILEGKK